MRNQLKAEIIKLNTFFSSNEQSESSNDVINHILNEPEGVVMMSELKKLNNELELTNEHPRIKASNNFIIFVEFSLQIVLTIIGWALIIQMDLFNNIYREFSSQCEFKATAHSMALLNEDSMTSAGQSCQSYLIALKNGAVKAPTYDQYFILFLIVVFLVFLTRFLAKWMTKVFKKTI